MKKFLASLGFGAAKVDLQLEQNYVTMGEQVNGKVVVNAGDVEQKSDGLTISFQLSSHYKRGDYTQFVQETVATIPITTNSFTLQPGERLEFPFSFVCPTGLPISSVTTHYYFATDLHLKQAIDAHDKDYIEVLPRGILLNFIEAFRELGFRHRAESYTGNKHGEQIIEFLPTQWLYGKFDEIVFSYYTKTAEQRIAGRFELDKRTHGLLGALADELDLDEKKGMYSFDRYQLSSVDQAIKTIQNFITNHSKNLYG
jgi:sporulation-control protein